MSIEDFIHVSMENDLPDQEIIVDETGIDEVSAETFTRLRIDPERLRNANDDYDSILFNHQREIVLKKGEYVLGVPPPKEMVSNEPSQDTGDDDRPLI